MELQNGARNLRHDRSEEDLVEDVRLVGARDDHDDLPRGHDRADAHRDGCGRDLVDGREEALVRLAGHVRQLHLVRYTAR